MNTYPTAPQAWDRTRHMARSIGVDLPRAVLDGWLTRRDLDSLVCACAACASTTCPPPATGRPEPSACTNRATLESLRL